MALQGTEASPAGSCISGLVLGRARGARGGKGSLLACAPLQEAIKTTPLGLFSGMLTNWRKDDSAQKTPGCVRAACPAMTSLHTREN